MTLALKVDALRSEIALADSSYENYTQTGTLSGMAPHEMRDYIEVRENELRSLTLANN